MFRFLIICMCFLLAIPSLATIYEWTDLKGVTSFGQIRPTHKGIPSRAVTVTPPKRSNPDSPPSPSAQESADSISDSNLKRQATRDKATQAQEAITLIQQQCANAKKNLAQTKLGGNRLYKDSSGQYSRLTDEERRLKQQTLTDFIQQNCY